VGSQLAWFGCYGLSSTRLRMDLSESRGRAKGNLPNTMARVGLTGSGGRRFSLPDGRTVSAIPRTHSRCCMAPAAFDGNARARAGERVVGGALRKLQCSIAWGGVGNRQSGWLRVAGFSWRARVCTLLARRTAGEPQDALGPTPEPASGGRKDAVFIVCSPAMPPRVTYWGCRHKSLQPFVNGPYFVRGTRAPSG